MSVANADDPNDGEAPIIIPQPIDSCRDRLTPETLEVGEVADYVLDSTIWKEARDA